MLKPSSSWLQSPWSRVCFPRLAKSRRSKFKLPVRYQKLSRGINHHNQKSRQADTDYGAAPHRRNVACLWKALLREIQGHAKLQTNRTYPAVFHHHGIFIRSGQQTLETALKPKGRGFHGLAVALTDLVECIAIHQRHAYAGISRQHLELTIHRDRRMIQSQRMESPLRLGDVGNIIDEDLGSHGGPEPENHIEVHWE